MRSYLAGSLDGSIPLLTASLLEAGFASPVVADHINVTELGLASPQLAVLDIDHLEVDALELLRMLRFVLPECIIAVYSGTLERDWARRCHLAGANCVLSKSSDGPELVAGLRRALSSGCFTDPRFAPDERKAPK